MTQRTMVKDQAPVARLRQMLQFAKGRIFRVGVTLRSSLSVIFVPVTFAQIVPDARPTNDRIPVTRLISGVE